MAPDGSDVTGDPSGPRVPGDGTPFALLTVALRTRAETVAELAQLAVRDPADVRDELSLLAADGYLHLEGDRIHYAHPGDAVAGMTSRRAGELGAEVARGLAELAELTARLPELNRSWSLGRGGDGEGLVDVQVFHGADAVVGFWHVEHARRPVRRTDVVLPDAARLHVADPQMQAVWHDASRGEGRRARVIVSIADATHPDAQERLAAELASGVEFRLLAEPPGWFWVADDATVALPLAWGERWPTSVMSVHSRAVAGMAGWIFERLWERAVPVGADGAGWEPLLALMSEGATLEAASRALGISARTGRRRLSEAMGHFGAGSMLELGIAWASGRDVRRR